MKIPHCDQCKKKADFSIKTVVKSEIDGSDATCDMYPYARATWKHTVFEIDLCKECTEPMVEQYLQDLYKKTKNAGIFKKGVFSEK